MIARVYPYSTDGVIFKERSIVAHRYIKLPGDRIAQCG